MNPTHNTLPEHVRAQVCDILSARLMDAGDLYFQAKTAHWNVKGPNFRALHKLFDTVAQAAAEAADLIAERAVQLGAIVESNVQAIAQRTSLDEYPVAIVDEHEHVHAISATLARFGELVREGIDQTEEIGDMGTSDMLIDIVREVDKLLWFVESHLGEASFAHSHGGRRNAGRAHSRR
jgi:starvation-inducible DNA-binding protein